MPIDYSAIAAAGGFGKDAPGVLRRSKKQRAKKSAWRKTAKAVDQRDAVDESPVCFITGKRLQTLNQLDEWTFRDRAHIKARSTNPGRKHDATNVLSVCRGAHRLLQSCALLLLNKRLKPATSIRSIHCVAWNRRMVPKKDAAPCRIRKGLPVVELDEVRD